MTHASASSSVPLCVDLDGSLVRTDTFMEGLIQLLVQRPWIMLFLPVWLLHGRASLKARIAQMSPVRASTLPYHTDLLSFLREERDRGRQIVLVTAAAQPIADAVAAQVGVFSAAFGSTPQLNLAGRHKEAFLVSQYGRKGFDYVGNERRDLLIWRSARRAITVNTSPRVRRTAVRVSDVERSFPDRPGQAGMLLRSMRPHQWVKNLLILIPVVAAHRLASLQALQAAALAFVAFSACASAVYLINDLVDLPSDRQHLLKRSRPLAAGHLSPMIALAAAVLLILGAFAVSMVLPAAFTLVLFLYLCLTTAYSLYFKRIMLMDVLLLAGLYTLRIVAGHAATGMPYSFWLLLFSLFVFLSLALLKRYSEILLLARDERRVVAGRGYTVDDAPSIQSLGSASAYLSVLVLALYLNTPDVTLLYRHPAYLWFILPPMLYWVSRLWMLAHRNQIHEDPIVFALRDPHSYLVAGSMAVVALLAT